MVKLSPALTNLAATVRVTLNNGTDAVITHLNDALQQAVALDEFSSVLDANKVSAEIYYIVDRDNFID